jgi:hypothetical protein
MGECLLHLCTCRGPRLLQGHPTTVHSPVRQAIALAARLVGVLLQIMCILGAHMARGGWKHGGLPRICDGHGAHLYTLSKARTVWLAHTVNVCLSYRVGGWMLQNMPLIREVITTVYRLRQYSSLEKQLPGCGEVHQMGEPWRRGEGA